jgi:hypothetical protein
MTFNDDDNSNPSTGWNSKMWCKIMFIHGPLKINLQPPWGNPAIPSGSLVHKMGTCVVLENEAFGISLIIQHDAKICNYFYNVMVFNFIDPELNVQKLHCNIICRK